MSNANKVHAAMPAATDAAASSVAQLAEAAGLSLSAVRRHVATLVAEGKATATEEKTAQGRTTVYRQAAGTATKATHKGVRKAATVKAPAAAPADTAPAKATRTRKAPAATPKAPGQTAREIVEAAVATTRDRRQPAKARKTGEVPAEGRGRTRKAAAPAVEAPAADVVVWVPTKRAGLAYHTLSAYSPTSTMCARSTLSKTSMRMTEDVAKAAGMHPCDRCRINTEAAQAAVDASEAAAPANTPDGDGKAASVAAGTVESWLSERNPEPNVPARPKRTRQAAPDAQPKAAFGRGELRDAVLRELGRATGRGNALTAGQIAAKLNSHVPPVRTNLARMLDKGLVVNVATEDTAPAYKMAAAS